MPSSPVEFWFEFASTYSYPAAMQIESLAQKAGRPLVWRPFLLGPIFANQGWRDSPFNLFPTKGRYMWRDLERLCAREGLEWRRPSEFPRRGLLAARVACGAAGEAWLPAFVRAIFRANFVEDRDVTNPGVIGDVLAGLDRGIDPAAWLARAQEQQVKDLLREQTEAAQALGIFGAPTFVVDGELFWGNERLADALAWQASAA